MLDQWLYYKRQYLEPTTKSKGGWLPPPLVADVTMNSLVAWRLIFNLTDRRMCTSTSTVWTDDHKIFLQASPPSEIIRPTSRLCGSTRTELNSSCVSTFDTIPLVSRLNKRFVLTYFRLFTHFRIHSLHDTSHQKAHLGVHVGYRSPNFGGPQANEIFFIY